jgi:hypothetical protein
MLGQMAATDYVDKLPVLYAEFVEAAAHSPDKTHFVAFFSGARDLMEKTPLFWKNYVQGKLNGEFGGLHHFLRLPFPDGPNWYLDQIEANMEILVQRLQTPKPGK